MGGICDETGFGALVFLYMGCHKSGAYLILMWNFEILIQKEEGKYETKRFFLKLLGKLFIENLI